MATRFWLSLSLTALMAGSAAAQEGFEVVAFFTDRSGVRVELTEGLSQY